ncbi:hypothetical protein KC845_03930 [Candidatus Kaiserbacteria bacterium]|nr:hypothetical protein [Candidatus Kaiserbacteria bacterium]
MTFSFVSVNFIHAEEEVEFDFDNQLTCNEIRDGNGLSAIIPISEEVSGQAGQIFILPIRVVNSFPYQVNDISITGALYKEGSLVPVDWFPVAQNISVPEDGTENISLEWQVPDNTPAGNYSLSIFMRQGMNQSALNRALSKTGSDDNIRVNLLAAEEATAHFVDNSLTIDGNQVVVGQTNTFATESEDLTLSVDFLNTDSENSIEGPLTLTVYGGVYPNELTKLDSETIDAVIFPDETASYTYDFSSAFDRYVVTGEFLTEAGARDTFIFFLEREGTDDPLTPSLPYASFIGVDAGNQNIIACIGNNQSALVEDQDLEPGYVAEYRLSVYSVDENDKAIVGDPITTALGNGGLGSNVLNFGFAHKLDSAPNAYAVKLEVLKDGQVVDEMETIYDCSEMFGCDQAMNTTSGSQKTIFGMSMSAIVMAMQIVTLVLLLIIVSIFVVNVYPLALQMVGRRKNKSYDNSGINEFIDEENNN